MQVIRSQLSLSPVRRKLRDVLVRGRTSQVVRLMCRIQYSYAITAITVKEF